MVVPPKDLTLDLDAKGRALHSTDLLVGNATMPAKAAAAMAGAMRPQGGGHGKFPLVRAMGHGLCRCTPSNDLRDVGPEIFGQ